MSRHPFEQLEKYPIMVTQGLHYLLFYNDFSKLRYIKTSGFSSLTFYSLTGQQCENIKN